MSEPIAIVGLGGVLPGATQLDDFWRVVEGGVDTASEPPPGDGRWTSIRRTRRPGRYPTASTPAEPASYATSNWIPPV